jgi:uncharacterized protein with PIN domain
MRAEVTHGVFLHSDQPDRQLQEVLRRLDLYRLARPFSRCVTCNGTLARLSLEDAWRRVPERTRRYVSEFFRCTGCDHTYWRGTHWDRLQELVENALNPAPADACQPPVAP